MTCLGLFYVLRCRDLNEMKPADCPGGGGKQLRYFAGRRVRRRVSDRQERVSTMKRLIHDTDTRKPNHAINGNVLAL